MLGQLQQYHEQQQKQWEKDMQRMIEAEEMKRMEEQLTALKMARVDIEASMNDEQLAVAISLREQSHDASVGDRAYEAGSVELDTEPEPWSP